MRFPSPISWLILTYLLHVSCTVSKLWLISHNVETVQEMALVLLRGHMTDFDIRWNWFVLPVTQFNLFCVVFGLVYKLEPKYWCICVCVFVQCCEMNVAGYQFAVLDTAFLLHKGFKSTDSFHSYKYVDQNRNRQLYRDFKRTMKMRYPSSKYSCWV